MTWGNFAVSDKQSNALIAKQRTALVCALRKEVNPQFFLISINIAYSDSLNNYLPIKWTYFIAWLVVCIQLLSRPSPNEWERHERGDRTMRGLWFTVCSSNLSYLFVQWEHTQTKLRNSWCDVTVWSSESLKLKICPRKRKQQLLHNVLSIGLSNTYIDLVVIESLL